MFEQVLTVYQNGLDPLRDLLFNKTPVFACRGSAATSENWGFTGIFLWQAP